METPEKEPNIIQIITIVGLIWFILNIVKFYNKEGNEMPIPTTLFNLIIILAFFTFILYKKVFIKEEKNHQEKLDKYFKK